MLWQQEEGHLAYWFACDAPWWGCYAGELSRPAPGSLVKYRTKTMAALLARDLVQVPVDFYLLHLLALF